MLYCCSAGFHVLRFSHVALLFCWVPGLVPFIIEEKLQCFTRQKILWKFSYFKHTIIKVDNLTAIKPWVGRTFPSQFPGFVPFPSGFQCFLEKSADILMSSSLYATLCPLGVVFWRPFPCHTGSSTS